MQICATRIRERLQCCLTLFAINRLPPCASRFFGTDSSPSVPFGSCLALTALRFGSATVLSLSALHALPCPAATLYARLLVVLLVPAREVSRAITAEALPQWERATTEETDGEADALYQRPKGARKPCATPHRVFTRLPSLFLRTLFPTHDGSKQRLPLLRFLIRESEKPF